MTDEEMAIDQVRPCDNDRFLGALVMTSCHVRVVQSRLGYSATEPRASQYTGVFWVPIFLDEGLVPTGSKSRSLNLSRRLVPVSYDDQSNDKIPTNEGLV